MAESKREEVIYSKGSWGLYTFELLNNLGCIAPGRIVVDPLPGTCTTRDLLRLHKKDGHIFDLVDGTLVAKAVGFTEAMIAAECSSSLCEFVNKHDLGVIVGPSGWMKFGPGLARSSEVAFVSWPQLPGRKLPRQTIPRVYPDLAVEILRSGNTRREMVRKRREYFRAGTRLVWMVNPPTRTVDVYTQVDEFTTLTEQDSLDGGVVLPSFKLPIRKLFANLPGNRSRRSRANGR